MWSSGTEKPTGGQKMEHFTMNHSIKQFMARISDCSSKVDLLVIFVFAHSCLTDSPSVPPGIRPYCSSVLNAHRHLTHWNQAGLCYALNFKMLAPSLQLYTDKNHSSPTVSLNRTVLGHTRFQTIDSPQSHYSFLWSKSLLKENKWELTSWWKVWAA